jgi:hypothetical protein
MTRRRRQEPRGPIVAKRADAPYAPPVAPGATPEADEVAIDPLKALARLAPTMKGRESLRAWARAAGTTITTLLRAMDGDDKVAIGTVRRLLEVAGWKAAAVPSTVHLTVLGAEEEGDSPLPAFPPVTPPAAAEPAPPRAAEGPAPEKPKRPRRTR